MLPGPYYLANLRLTPTCCVCLHAGGAAYNPEQQVQALQRCVGTLRVAAWFWAHPTGVEHPLEHRSAMANSMLHLASVVRSRLAAASTCSTSASTSSLTPEVADQSQHVIDACLHALLALTQTEGSGTRGCQG